MGGHRTLRGPSVQSRKTISRNWLWRSSQLRSAASGQQKIITQRTQAVELLWLIVRPVVARLSGLPDIDACQSFRYSAAPPEHRSAMRILRIISSMFSAGSFTIPARPCGRTATFPFVLGSCTRCGPARSRGTTRWSIFELQPSLPDSLIFIRTASKSTKQKGRSYSARSISHCANPWWRSELSAGEILSRRATAICAISSCVSYVRNFHGAPDRRPAWSASRSTL